MAPRPFCVCWDGVKWAANVPSAFVGGGFAPGLGLCCEALALAFDFLALAGVPSPCLPVDLGGGGFLGLTVLFLWLGGLLFLLYIPPQHVPRQVDLLEVKLRATTHQVIGDVAGG